MPSSAGAPCLERLHEALVALPPYRAVTLQDLEPLPHQGVAHDHVRIKRRRAVIRVPRLSQFQLEPRINLAYQAQCFARAEASGRTPALKGILQPQPGLTGGALIVEEIEGRPPVLPRDLASIAETQARVHLLPMPDAALRPPLADHADPVAGTLGFIEAQFPFVERAVASAKVRRTLATELDWARGFARSVSRRPQPQSLVLTDAHPGNFLIEASGRAVFVDLEKMVYGSPAADLAHASLLTSTLWDRRVARALTSEETRDFYRHYLGLIGRRRAAELVCWLTPFRRLIWLRTTSWAARWIVLSTEPGSPWSAASLPADLRDYTARRISGFFDPTTIEQIRAEWLRGGLDFG